MTTANPSAKDLQQILDGPAAASLEAADRALFAVAQDAFTELGKLVRNIQLYGNDHQANQRFRARFTEAMQAMLAERDVVEVRIGPYEMTLFDRVLYENDSPDRNFIYTFFMDGVRFLTFHAGLTVEELDGLVDILLVDWSDPALFEDDVVTMMWEREFQHIGYLLAADYDDDSREGEAHHYTIAGVLENVRHRAADRMEAATGDRRAQAKNVPSDVSLGESDLERFQAQPFAMDEEEFYRLRAVLQTTGRETLEKFIEILFKVSLDEGEDDDARVVGIFARIADLQLESGNIGELERLMRKVRRLEREGPRGEAAVRRTFARWSQPEFVHRVGAVLSDRSSPYTPSALAVFRLLDDAAVPTICQLAPRVRLPERREQLVAMFPSLVRTPEQGLAVAHLLADADPELAHELLKPLVALNDPQVLAAAARTGLQNPDQAVRLECLGALQSGDPRLRELLFQALGDGAKPVRSKAIHLLARVPDAEVHERILGCIEDKGFAGYDLDEKRRYFVAAALTGDPSARFLQLLGSGRLIGRSRAHEEARHGAAVALAVRMCPQAVPLFQKELGRRLKSEVVVEACAWALDHVQQDRETRTRQLYDIFFAGSLSPEGARG